MSSPEYFAQSTFAVDKRFSTRRKLLLPANATLDTGDVLDLLIHNISETGLLVESDTSLTTGDRFEIELPHGEPIWARTVWVSGHLFGCEFETKISPAALSAAELRSGVDAAPHFDSDISQSTERFGARLQRLRASKGLSQTDVADRMGVSAPSISGWEKGRARPKPNRVAALASLLEVPVSELLGDPAPERLQDLIDRSRDQIARAIGTSADNVRIVVEL